MGGIRPQRRVSAAVYQEMLDEGYSPEEIAAEGYERDDGAPGTVAPRPQAVASDATRAMTVRRQTPETVPDPYGPARTMVNALTMGTSPTIRGAVHAVGSVLPGGRSPGEAYREEKDAEIAGIRNFAQRHGPEALGLNVVAGLPLALASGAAAAPKLAKSLTGGKEALRNIGIGTGVGAGTGFVSGFGGAEGDFPAQLKAGGKSALIGGGIGAGVSAGLEGVLRAGRGATKTGRTLVGRPSEEQLTQGTDDAFEEWLLRTGQDKHNVAGRATAARGAGIPNITAGEAMGPAGPGMVKAMGPLNPPAAGKAFQAGEDMLEQAGQRVTTPEVSQLYDEARQVGAVQLPAKGTKALNFLNSKFPKIGDDLTKYIEDKGIPWSSMVDDQGNFTLEYLDLYKKNIDAQLYGKSISQKAKDAAWIKLNRNDIEAARGQLVDAIDDAVRKQTGGNVYRDARRVAESNIGTQQELGETRETLGKALQQASGRVNPEGLMEEAATVAGFGSQRPKIGVFQAIADKLKGGVRKSARRQADRSLDALLGDPDILLQEIARREVERKMAAAGRSAFRGVTAPAFTVPLADRYRP